RGYNKSAKIYQSAFMGYFPFNDPQYSIGIVIQNSNESKHVYGASVSGPVFREVADQLYASIVAKKYFNPKNVNPDYNLYKVYGMKKDLNKIFTEFNYKQTDSAKGTLLTSFLQDGNAKLLPADIATSSDAIPDVLGLGLKDAVYLLEKKGLKVLATGKGKVVSQSLAQNTGNNKGSTIKIELN
ncbi:MAG TPA: PASTA domain-containing protein, partial [Hanamia sp.]